MKGGNSSKMIRSTFFKTASLRGFTWSKCEYIIRTTSFRRYSDFVKSDSEQTNEVNTNYDNGSIPEAQTGSHNTDVYERQTTVPSSRNIPRNPDELYRRYLMTPDQPESPRLLRVAIIGAPNAGKSSLINSLMGWKVTGVSKKVHTTKANTNTIFNIIDTQIILVDTPGVIDPIQRKRHRCDGSMLVDPERSIQEADVVGVIVDVADKWTRLKLNPVLLKMLHLHENVPSFLILNKVDELRDKSIVKQQNIYLHVLDRLTLGTVAGRPISTSYTERLKNKDKPPEYNKKYFSELEKKYGKLDIHGSKTESEISINFENNNINSQESSVSTEQFVNDIMNRLSSESASKKSAVTKKLTENEDACKKSTLTEKLKENVPETFEYENTVTSSIDSEIDVTNFKSQTDETTQSDSNVDNTIKDSSYQSEYLANILSKQPAAELALKLDTDNNDDTDWTQKAAVMKNKTMKMKKGWEHFDRVFLTSTLDGTGIDDVKDYLVSIAKPHDWIYHSSVITDQHPHDIAKMCIIQSCLEYIDNYVPYIMRPEIVYWDIDEHNRLNIAVDVYVNNKYEMQLVLTEGGADRLRSISSSARQALMDSFQCEVRFKLAFKVGGRRK